MSSSPSTIGSLRSRFLAWRRQRARVEAMARAEVAADEAAEAKRRSWTLSEAWREFWRHASPRTIAVILLGATAVRLTLGDWVWTDALVPALMIAAFPFVEWTVHVFLLHFRPRNVGGRRVDPLVARKHREHHERPKHIPLVFIPVPALLVNLAGGILIALFAFNRLALGMTYLVALSGIGMVYEWTHYLVHTDYRPKTELYRSVWRNHRLHHYKNENYWFTLTTANTADRLFRTNPDPADVETSPTVMNLHAATETG